jgi:RHS repeat-associated protein
MVTLVRYRTQWVALALLLMIGLPAKAQTGSAFCTYTPSSFSAPTVAGSVTQACVYGQGPNNCLVGSCSDPRISVVVVDVIGATFCPQGQAPVQVAISGGDPSGTVTATCQTNNPGQITVTIGPGSGGGGPPPPSGGKTLDGTGGDGSSNGGCSGDGDTNSLNSPGQLEGDPINATNGNLYETFHDYGGYGPCPLVFDRYYNSLGSVTGTLGTKWSHSYSAFIRQTSSTTVQATRGSQKVLTFSLVGSTWAADPDVNVRLLQQTDSAGATTGWLLTSGHDNVETYNASGVLISVATRAGLTQTLAYNGLGQLSTVTDPFGRTLTFNYDSSGRINTMVDAAGRTNTYSYDVNNNLASITWPDGTAQQYIYERSDFPNFLTRIIDELGTRYATFTYNTAGLASASFLAAGGVDGHSFAYNAAGNSTTSTDTLGHVHTFSYNALFGVSHTANVVEPLPGGGGAQSAWAYDANGNVASYTDFNKNITTYSYDLTRNLQLQVARPDGRVTTTTWNTAYRLPASIVTGSLSDQRTYDAHGNLLQRVLSDASIPYSQTWSYTYNANGQPLTIVDPNGNPTMYAYDVLGDLVSVTDPLGHATRMTYDAQGKRLTSTDPNGLTTTYSYDTRGRLIKSAAGKLTTAYAYSATGTLTSVSWPSGYGITNTYDSAHRLTEIADVFGNLISYTLDPLNNRTGETHSNASGSTVYAHSWKYDVLNRVAQSVGAAGQTSNLTYDPNGNLLSVSDPLGHVTSMTYDAINRLSQFTAADGGSTVNSYDQFDRVIAVTDPRAAKTSYVIDAMGNTRGTISPDAGVSTTTPDADGNVIARVDANGYSLAYAYDSLNRLIKVSRTDTNSVLQTYTYDQADSAHSNGVGHLTSMTDPSGTTNWAYDANGHVAKKTQSVAGLTFITSYGYDPVSGNPTSMTLPSGAALGYSYSNGTVASITVSIKGVTTSLVSGLQYEPFGGPSAWTLGNGETDGRGFDLDGRFISDGVDTSINYDAASRITALTLATGVGHSYTYDSVGRLTGLASTDGTKPYGYSYDLAGNRVAQTIGKAATSYTIGTGNNRLLSASIKNGLTAFSYDADGSRLGEGTATYTYDLFERLTTGTGPNGSKTYVYNGFGQRLVKYGVAILDDDGAPVTPTPGFAATYFVYDDAGHLIGEYNTKGKPIEETVYLGDMPVAVIKPSGVFFVHSDYRNAPRQIDNSLKAAVWSWDPRGFGDSNPSQNLSRTTFVYKLRFPGQYYDGETLKNYNLFRTYDFTVGRYFEVDPIGQSRLLEALDYSGRSRADVPPERGTAWLDSSAEERSLIGNVNGYVYANQNPVQFDDPRGEGSVGMFCIFATAAACGIPATNQTIGCGPGSDCAERVSRCTTQQCVEDAMNHPIDWNLFFMRWASCGFYNIKPPFSPYSLKDLDNP